MGEIAQLPRPEPLVGSLGSNARLHEPPIGAVEVLLDRRGREHGQTLGRALKVAKKRKRPQAAPRRAEKLLASRHRGEGGAKRLRQVAFARRIGRWRPRARGVRSAQGQGGPNARPAPHRRPPRPVGAGPGLGARELFQQKGGEQLVFPLVAPAHAQDKSPTGGALCRREPRALAPERRRLSGKSRVSRRGRPKPIGSRRCRRCAR